MMIDGLSEGYSVSGISSTMQYCAPDQKLAAYKAKEILSQVLAVA
jgi:hypothetical protein